jgi:hypothetical protein
MFKYIHSFFSSALSYTASELTHDIQKMRGKRHSTEYLRMYLCQTVRYNQHHHEPYRTTIALSSLVSCSIARMDIS